MTRFAPAAAFAAASALLPLLSPAQPTFQSHTIASGNIVAHADFNGDGREDIVRMVISSDLSSITHSLLLSDGDGTYKQPVALPASVDAIGDFNHDGKLDFISYRTGAGAINEYTTPTVYLGNGDGTFQPGKSISGAIAAPNGESLFLIPADFNHDNKTDFVTVEETVGNGSNGYPSLVHMWLSNGDGSFTEGQTFTTEDPDPSNPNVQLDGVYTGDFDGDGKPDLALVYELFTGPIIVQVWYGDGAGHLGSPTYLTDPHGYYAGEATVADVTNTGRSDLIFGAGGLDTDRYGSFTYYPLMPFFSGNANRTLSYSTIATSECASTPVVADFNGDGINDLAYIDSPCTSSPGGGNSTSVIALGSREGTFSEVTVGQILSGGSQFYALRSTTGTRPDLAYTQATAETPSYTYAIALLSNTSPGSFPGCGLSGMAEGVQVCSPSGANATSPVSFSVAAAGPTPMRTAAVWVDGKKVAEQLTHSFSNYSFLNASVALAAGSHAVTVFGTGWDDTLQQKSFTLNVGSGACTAPAQAGVHLCQPASGATVSSPVSVAAAATITGQLDRMELWVDGVKKYTESSGLTLSTSLSLPAGSHRFGVFAVNTAGTKWEQVVYATVK